MRLLQLLEGIKVLNTEITDKNINNLTADSRLAGNGDVFVAIKGYSVDGHSYIPSLKGRGVAAVVVEDLPDTAARDEQTIYIQVEDTSDALGKMASNFYGNPSGKLKLVGVTGTNGKTTVATLIYDMARMQGLKAGLLSTVKNMVDDTEIVSTHTTPDPISINRLLARMVEAGCEIASMEISSHAAHQKRIAGLTFAGGIFTNLTRDHLDYHKTTANYRDAKKLFFDSLNADSFALINADDKNGEFMVQNCDARKYTYSLHSLADFKSEIIEKHLDSTLVSFNGTDVETLFTGVYNVYNLTAVFGCCLLLGFDKDSTLIDLSRLHPVKGRFQTAMSADGITAVIDYAHTPDALTNVISSIRDVLRDNGSIITVVGAGGNRDKGKRPMMGKAAAELSDKTILTSDNPRDEDPVAIINDMKDGIPERMRNKVFTITDRLEAIRTAVAIARKGDVVLIAGKGHENYQEIKGVKHHFDDMEETVKVLNNR